MEYRVAFVDMRSGINHLLARTIEVFGASHPHHAYVFANCCGSGLKELACNVFDIWLAVRRLHKGSALASAWQHMN